MYESEKLVGEYLLFHYGTAEDILPTDAPAGMAEALDFAVRTPSRFSPGGRRGLDLGCAVGRSTYEMSRHCDKVLGIDFSRAFVEAAADLADHELTYPRRDEGHLTTSLTARLPAGVEPGRVRFEVGDAMALRDDLGRFDRVHAANLLCRLTEPLRALQRFADLVEPGGELILTTPCTWLGEFTPPENWPESTTLDWIATHLGPSFELLHTQHEPFLIRETARKFQWSRAELSHWLRR